MTKTNTGGPAFPVFPDTEVGHAAAFRGMTLRDYFAAKAVQGMMAEGQIMRMVGSNDLANIAYEMAEAMLKAREQ